MRKLQFWLKELWLHWILIKSLSVNSIVTVEVYSIWLKLRYECLALSPEISGMLKKLSRNFTLALITNGTSSSQWEKINILKLRSYFSCILVSGDLPWEKPNKNIFLQVNISQFKYSNQGRRTHQATFQGGSLLGAAKSRTIETI